MDRKGEIPLLDLTCRGLPVWIQALVGGGVLDVLTRMYPTLMLPKGISTCRAKRLPLLGKLEDLNFGGPRRLGPFADGCLLNKTSGVNLRAFSTMLTEQLQHFFNQHFFPSVPISL